MKKVGEFFKMLGAGVLFVVGLYILIFLILSL